MKISKNPACRLITEVSSIVACYPILYFKCNKLYYLYNILILTEILILVYATLSYQCRSIVQTFIDNTVKTCLLEAKYMVRQ